MILMTEAPPFPPEIALGPPTFSSTDGEVLAALSEEAAGPWLAVLVDEIDLANLPSSELPEFLKAANRVKARADYQIYRGVAELSRRSDVEAPAAEVALALKEPRGTADRRVWTARRLVRCLPKVMRWLRCGDLSAKHVDGLVRATATVDDPDLLEEVQDRVLEFAGSKTPDELARHARDILRRLDPKGAKKRAEAARDEADVVLYPGDDEGVADVVATMPVEDAAIVKAGVDAYAMTAKNAGDPRKVGVLRAEGLARMASDYLAGRCRGGAAPVSGGRPVEVGVVVGLATALGLRDLPGEVPGLGIVPREAIAAMIGREQAKLRLMVIDELTGRLLYRATDAYRPTAEQVAQVRATYVYSVGPGSKVLASRCDIDHAVEHPDGETVVGNLAPLDRSWHNDKTHRSLRVTIGDTGTAFTTSPLGQTREVAPYDYRVVAQGPDGDGCPPF